jgi:pimeloyl-ACP methyl ester carboxylesterase
MDSEYKVENYDLRIRWWSGGRRSLNSIQSRICKVNGIGVHYFTKGEGAPLIILHGGSDGADAWKANIALLAKHYRVFAPNLPGFGLSAEVLSSYKVNDLADFIDQFAANLGLQKFYLMGHSFGGGIAAHYALKYPQKVRKLILVSSLCLGKEIAWWIRLVSLPGIYNFMGETTLAVYKMIKKAAKFLGPWDVVQPITHASVQIGSEIANFTQQTIVLMEQLPSLLMPTLVLWGEKDPVVPAYQAYEAAALIPDCRVRVFAKCGHSVYRERLNDFSSEISGFLG